MSHPNPPGLLSGYNSLTDKHLAGYFSNARIKRHLQRAGLITRSGRLIPDKEYKHKLIQRTHQRRVRECLAQAIFHKVLEMERLHQLEIKRKLEEFVTKERVHRMKVERSRRYEEGIVRILSPRPPTGVRNFRKEHSGPEAENSESSESPSSSRPNTAPGKMQRQVRLKPIHSNSTTASLRRSSPYRVQESPHENNQLFPRGRKSHRHLTTMETTYGISPYCLPVINNFVTPVPPVTKKKERGLKVTHSSTIRGRRLHPTTVSCSADEAPWLRSSVHQTKVRVNMVYFGKTVHLSNDLIDMTDEVKVFQQHCGGENLCVYKGYLREGETFQFISRRHKGFPFSLTFYLNGLQVERLSSCCEFKHRRGPRLGGRHGHFGFSSVEGASPCYRCIVAMGLDKKPSPPPKSVKEDSARKHPAVSPVDAPPMETERTEEEAGSHFESDTSPTRDPETHTEEQTAPAGSKVRDDYEEDFEADDEGPVDEATVKGEKSPSPLSETEKHVQKKDASETDDNGNDGSSFSGGDEEESDVEDPNESKKDEIPDEPTEEHQEEVTVPSDEKDEPKSEVTGASKVGSAFDSAGDSTEIELYDTSTTSGTENKQNDDEETGHENAKEDEEERAKSVQEKLAEAIMKESQSSSEPELSDTSTEEEEGPTQHSNSKDRQQTLVEETKFEESLSDEVAQEQRELSETKEEENDKQQPCDNPESIKDEKVGEVVEDEKAVEDEARAEADKSKEPWETQLCVEEENVAQDNKTANPPEGGMSADAEASEKDEEREAQAAQVGDVHADETGQRAKSGEVDESPILELNTKTDESAGPDDAEAEAMTASETMEIKEESSEEREALSCEKAPEADAEKSQQADSKDKTASEMEITAETISSSPEEAGDSTDEKTADIQEEMARDESDNNEIKEEAKEQSSKANERKNGNELEEEKFEKSVEEHEETEKQEDVEEEKQIHLNPDEITEDENTEEREQNKTEGINDDGTADDSNDKKTTDGTENQKDAAEPHDEGNEVGKDNVVKEEKTVKDENSDCVDNQRFREEPEAEGDDKNHDDGAETNMASEGKDDGAGTSEEVENENNGTESETDEKCEEIKAVTEDTAGEPEEMCGITEESEKAEDADVDKEETKVCSEKIPESEDVRDSEAAEELKTAEETPNTTEHVQSDTAGAREKGEIDAENQEITSAAESKDNEDEEQAPAEEKNESETADQAEEERKMEEAKEIENTAVKQVTVESGESSEKHMENIVDQVPDHDPTESDAIEGDGSLEKHDESNKNDAELETSGPETKEDPTLDEQKDNEETGEEEDEENVNDTHTDHGKEFKLTKTDNKIKNISDVGLSADQEKPSASIDEDEDDTVNQPDERQVESAHDNLPDTDENLVGAELPAADGENGEDAEEVSKASEEGASVLLKPQRQNETEQSVAMERETPEDLATQDNTDLVTEWIKMHQSSKYFETFVEPLEDLKEEISDIKVSNPDDKETSGDEEELRKKNQEETKEMDRESIQGEDDQCENDPTKAALQDKDKTEVKNLKPNEKSEPRSHEGDAEENPTQNETEKATREENAFPKTEVESFSDSLKAGSILETQSGEKQTNTGSELKGKEASTNLSPDTGEYHKSEGPDELKETEQQVHQMTNFSASKSADGNQEGSHGEGIQSKILVEKISRETRDADLTEDAKHTSSNDHTSSIIVDRSLFGHTSYPLLTASWAEGGQ